MTTNFGLPCDLGDGLLLRWATPDDADELAEFNIRIHSDEPNDPQNFLGAWTRVLMSGDHPTVQAHDFTVVVDTNAGGKIVSSLNLISQRWAYAGIEFSVGRPELVGTDPAYRRRGLVRKQMEAVHAKSAARGEMVQAITGIPWYYRMFGYEMAVDLHGGRQFFWWRPGNYKPVEQEVYRLRVATAVDIPILSQLYVEHSQDSLLVRVRDEQQWTYELRPDNPVKDKFVLIEIADGTSVGYASYDQRGTSYNIHEFGVISGHSWRAVALFLTRHLKLEADKFNQEKEEKKQISNLSFNLGMGHPVYQALGRQLEKQILPYSWYIRIPDLPAFLRHIAPVLERRLADSVLAGYSGNVRINFFTSHMVLTFADGKLTEIGDDYPLKWFGDGDATFPDLTFLQLILGYRTWEELDRSFADCYVENPETAVLFDIIFPKQSSWIQGLN